MRIGTVYRSIEAKIGSKFTISCPDRSLSVADSSGRVTQRSTSVLSTLAQVSCRLGRSRMIASESIPKIVKNG